VRDLSKFSLCHKPLIKREDEAHIYDSFPNGNALSHPGDGRRELYCCGILQSDVLHYDH